MRAGADGARRGDRAQTTIDFAIGASIFLIGVAFVFTFIPGLMQPLQSDGNPASAIAAEKASSTLVENLLVDTTYGSGPTELNATCTIAFFEGNDVSDCPYEGIPLEDAFGLSTRNSNVNVTVYRLDGSVTQEDDIGGSDADLLARGDSTADVRDPSTISRIVYINGRTYRLTVTVW